MILKASVGRRSKHLKHVVENFLVRKIYLILILLTSKVSIASSRCVLTWILIIRGVPLCKAASRNHDTEGHVRCLVSAY